MSAAVIIRAVKVTPELCIVLACHFWATYARVDLYSCAPFDPQTVLDSLKIFNPSRVEWQLPAAARVGTQIRGPLHRFRLKRRSGGAMKARREETPDMEENFFLV
jgi:hypothetical protein